MAFIRAMLSLMAISLFIVRQALHTPSGFISNFTPGGDFTNTGHEQEVDDFCSFLKDLPHKHKIVVAGNHDIILHSEFYHQHWWRFHLSQADSSSVKERLKSVCHYLEVRYHSTFGSSFPSKVCSFRTCLLSLMA